MRLIFLISISLGLILLNGCSKINQEENVDQAAETLLRRIEVEGETREYLIHIPNSYDTTKSIPIVMNFHGLSQSVSDYIIEADMRLLAESDIFILI